jgi:hypothetical protein
LCAGFGFLDNGISGRSDDAAMPPSAWLGGITGSAYVVSVILVSPRLGLAATMALIIAGQTLGTMLLDHFGLLGFAVHPANSMRLLGAALLVGSVARRPKSDARERRTVCWREMDSNFQYASAERWHGATDLLLPPTVKRRSAGRPPPMA